MSWKGLVLTGALAGLGALLLGVPGAAIGGAVGGALGAKVS